jgi:putative transcriptional regulator
MPAPSPSGLAPGFLVAAPSLTDPNFARSLVLMAEHHGEGALGFVVNRPAPVTVSDVLLGAALADARATARFRRDRRAPRAGRDGLDAAPASSSLACLVGRPCDMGSIEPSLQGAGNASWGRN